MDKIASPQDLQLELRFLITACNKGSTGSSRPSREKLAAKLNELADRVTDRVAANPPEQTVKMLKDKIKGAQAIYDQLSATTYVKYNISDFWKSELPKARTLSDRITKRKKALQSTLYDFIRQAKKDLRDAEKSR